MFFFVFVFFFIVRNNKDKTICVRDDIASKHLSNGKKMQMDEVDNSLINDFQCLLVGRQVLKSM